MLTNFLGPLFVHGLIFDYLKNLLIIFINKKNKILLEIKYLLSIEKF